VGIVSRYEALRMAEEAELDLVEISPQAQPPVCKIMDFGKFRYQQQKKASEAKKKQKVIEVKEVKFRPGTEEADYQVKMRNVVRFLEEGNKVKITLRFRGREMAHQDIGMQMYDRIEKDLGDLAIVEQRPKLEGRQMVMVVAPRKH
jgi:translation initiation factor IF-3